MFRKENTTKILLGFFILFFAVVLLDQTTKWHAEKKYLTYSDPVKLEQYRASSLRVMTLGHSPLFVEEKSAVHVLANSGVNPAADSINLKESSNWLDFNITYLRNEGAVWGIFSDLPDFYRLTLFYSVTLIAVIGVLVLFRKATPDQIIYRTALSLILAGAIGNFIDRLLLKYVIDWIHFQWNIFGWSYSFPVFNVADISIDVGIGLMLLDSFLVEKRIRKAAVKDATPAEPVPATAL